VPAVLAVLHGSGACRPIAPTSVGRRAVSDPGVVSRTVLAAVLAERGSENSDANVLQQLAHREPILAAYISERVVSVSGKLALSGAPSEVVRAAYDDLIEVVAVAIRAMWKGQDEFWKGIDLAGLPGRRRRRAPRLASRPGNDEPSAPGTRE
jgi:hypothetical protein